MPAFRGLPSTANSIWEIGVQAHLGYEMYYFYYLSDRCASSRNNFIVYDCTVGCYLCVTYNSRCPCY